MWKVLDILGFAICCTFLAVLVYAYIGLWYEEGEPPAYQMLIMMLFAAFGIWSSGSLLWKKRGKTNNQEKEN